MKNIDLNEYSDDYRAMKKAEGWRVAYSFFGPSIREQIIGIIFRMLLFPVCILLPFIPLLRAISKFKKKEVRLVKEEWVFIVTPILGLPWIRVDTDEIKVSVNRRDRIILNIYGSAYLILFILFMAPWLHMIGNFLKNL